MKYKIGKKEFNTKAEIKDFYQPILKKNKVGSKLSKSKFEQVLELLKFHTEADEKIGVGIKYITTERHFDILTGFMARDAHFHIYRKDGTDVDFSYNNCINNIGSGYKGKESESIMKSLRIAVKYYIDEFRNKCFGKKRYLKCEVLGVNFSKRTCHIDHKAPHTFSELVVGFLKQNNIKLSDLKTKKVNNFVHIIADDNLREAWVKYHNDNANLRAIHMTANMSQRYKRFPKDML